MVGFGRYADQTYGWMWNHTHVPKIYKYVKWVIGCKNPYGDAFQSFQNWLKDQKKEHSPTKKRQREADEKQKKVDESKEYQKQKLHKARIAEVKRIKAHIIKMEKRRKHKIKMEERRKRKTKHSV